MQFVCVCVCVGIEDGGCFFRSATGARNRIEAEVVIMRAMVAVQK